MVDHALTHPADKDLACPFPAWVRTVGIAAPARPAEAAALTSGCARLRAWGLEVVISPAAVAPPCRYLAGDDDTRAAALHDLLRNPQVDLILALRGGYGCARLLPLLDWDLIRRAAKPMIGYSDITILHLAWLRAGVPGGLAGPMLAVDFARQPAGVDDAAALAFSMRSLAEAWTPRPGIVSLPRGSRLECLKPGRAEGPLVPCTLSVLTTLLGTPYLPDLRGHILVLEDVNEPAYKIDRYLTQLVQAGVWRELAGVIWGNLSGGEDAAYLPQILAEFALLAPGPVIAGLPFGHCWPMVTVPTGRIARMIVTTGVDELTW